MSSAHDSSSSHGDSTDAADPAGDPPRWIVLKFGGTSVSSLERWEAIHDQLEQRRREGYRPVLVCSALSQVSNQLEGLLADALAARDLKRGLAALRTTHERLAASLRVEMDDVFEQVFQELERTLLGLALTREATPRLRARLLCVGELLSTRLGVAWLRKRGMKVAWQDARELLEAQREAPSVMSAQRQFLSATCSYDADPELAARLGALDADAIVTQGFIARGPEGDTVLLGRGGSDTSAAYLAARLGAERLEIWTDVPGLFTANPKQVPEARLLRRLGYDEASELASRGAKVLHPRCLGPVRRHGIPVQVRCTPWPDVEGTVICAGPETRPGILGVVARGNLVLVNLDVEGTWQRVGVIADIASCFQDLGLSIDMLSSSQTHVTVAVDPAANQLGDAVLDALFRELAKFGSPRIVRATASVTLVGTSMVEVLHALGPLLENLEHENVHLVSHAANDLSLTFVVDREGADRLVRTLHGKLFELEEGAASDYGPTWQELRGKAGEAREAG